MINAKRFGFIAFILFTLFLFQGEAAALSIELNYYSIDFGNMNMGAIKDDVPSDGLVITCTTTAATPRWTLKIRNDYPLTHISNPASIIPDTYFKWYGISTNNPSNTSLVMTREDFTFEKTIYTGLAGEVQTSITIKFELTLPSLLQSGTYNTNIVFTFTE